MKQFDKLFKTLKTKKEKYVQDKSIKELFAILEHNCVKTEQNNFAKTLKQSTYMIEHMQNMDDFFVKLDFMDRQILDIKQTSNY